MYANVELDKTELLMNLKNRTLSTEIEYYQEIRNILFYILYYGYLGKTNWDKFDRKNTRFLEDHFICRNLCQVYTFQFVNLYQGM